MDTIKKNALALLTGLFALCLAAPALAVPCNGTPDLRGYSCSTEPYAWDATTSTLMLSNDGMSAAIPVPFEFYGGAAPSACVAANGYIELRAGACPAASAASASSLPGVAAPRSAIFAYWTDLDPSAGGTVRWGVSGVAPARRWVFSWTNVPIRNNPSIVVSAQIVLEELTGDVVVRHGTTSPSPAGATITAGLQNLTGTTGIEIASGAGAPPPQSAYRIHRIPLALDALAGTPLALYLGPENGTVQLRAAASGGNGVYIYDWDLDGNGSFETPGAAPIVSLAGRDGGTAAGRFTVTARVRDTNGGTVTRTADLSANNVAPTITPPVPGTAVVGRPYTLDLAATDPAGALDPISWQLLAPYPLGMSLASIPGGARLTWTPGAGSSGAVALFTVEARDDEGGVAQAAIQLPVLPAFSLATTSISQLDEGQSASLGATAAGGVPPYAFAWDVNGDGAFETQAASATFFAADGPRTATLRARVTDAAGVSLVVLTQVTVRNLPPTISTAPPTRLVEGQDWVYDAAAIDPAGAADPLLWSVVNGPQGFFLAGNGATARFSWRPGAGDVGSRAIIVGVDDGDGGVATQSFVLEVAAADEDGDGVPDRTDNCRSVPNADQADLDSDGPGDACDPDLDGDGVANDADLCPRLADPLQADLDGDGAGDACDADRDGDGIDGGSERTLGLSDDQVDSDADGIDDATEVGTGEFAADSDRDGELDALDLDSDDDGLTDSEEAGDEDLATPPVDSDGDGVEDFRDSDSDDDGALDGADLCRLVSDPAQRDSDADGLGDVCDGDLDGDGVPDGQDLCPLLADLQVDLDGDRTGDACDPDVDGDGIANEQDRCPLAADPGQEDSDADGLGDLCDPSPSGDAGSGGAGGTAAGGAGGEEAPGDGGAGGEGGGVGGAAGEGGAGGEAGAAGGAGEGGAEVPGAGGVGGGESGEDGGGQLNQAPPPPPSGGQGCQSGGGAPSLGLVILCLLALARRRR